MLTQFGQAFGKIPGNLGDRTEEQKALLDQAVSGLAQDDGKIVSVRLALFAEMVKGRPWTPVTLKDVGGMEGVGVTFLDETFSSPQANPTHRLHQRAAQAVLKALLPESGSDIKGHMRSHRELFETSGYAARPTDFDVLLRVLDGELRLITPTDPEGLGDEGGSEPKPPVERYYQLTHDYLVPSIRDWLTRKQKETRRGRAELLLAERASLWNAKPENRHLPSALEWANIRLLTKRRDWTQPQRKMMKRAGWVHGSRPAALVLLALLARGGIEYSKPLRASFLVDQLRDAETTQVPALIRQLDGYRLWANPRLKELVQSADDDSRVKLHGSLALLPVDLSQLPFLEKRLLSATPAEVPVIRDALEPHRSTLIPNLWSVLDSSKPGDVSLLPAAGALVLYDPENGRWAEVIDKVAKALLSVNSISLGDWLKYLTDVRSKLKPPLATIFRDKKLSESERTQVTNILADYASDDPDLLADLLLDSEEKPFAVLFDKLKARQERAVPVLEAELARKPAPDATADAQDQLAQRQARAAVALLRWGQGEKAWTLLRHSPDPSVRSYIVNWLKPLGAEPKTLMTRLESLAHNPVSIPKDEKSRMEAILFHPETSERRALILALGKYNADDLSPTEREPLMAQLLEAYRTDPDAGVHGAAEWTLRRWRQEETLKKVDAQLQRLKDRGDRDRRWYVNSEGQTLAVIEGPVEFSMGSPLSEPGRYSEETPHRQPINRRFAIATKEVTVEQYQRFLKENPKIAPLEIDTHSPEPTGPMNAMTWYEAAAYCNWLSEQEHLKPCYEPISEGGYAEGMKIRAYALEQPGYRLPTEAEWEYACRAGAVTSRYYGRSVELLGKYAWYLQNSQDRAWPCGQLLPNELGLFDMLGNVYEWCQEQSYSYPEGESNTSTTDSNKVLYINEKNGRLIRSGAFMYQPANVRSALRQRVLPSSHNIDIGFRLARTYH